MNDLEKHIKFISLACSKDVTRCHLMGIWFDHKAETAVATDGHVLFKSDLIYQVYGLAAKANPEAVFCPKSLKNRVLGVLNDPVKYPHWVQFFPKLKTPSKITLPLWFKELVGKKSPKDQGALAFHLETGALISNPITSDKIPFFNPYYLAPLVMMGEVNFGFKDDAGPALFQGDNWAYVVMPMRRPEKMVLAVKTPVMIDAIPDEDIDFQKEISENCLD